MDKNNNNQGASVNIEALKLSAEKISGTLFTCDVSVDWDTSFETISSCGAVRSPDFKVPYLLKEYKNWTRDDWDKKGIMQEHFVILKLAYYVSDQPLVAKKWAEKNGLIQSSAREVYFISKEQIMSVIGRDTVVLIETRDANSCSNMITLNIYAMVWHAKQLYSCVYSDASLYLETPADARYFVFKLPQ